jgi:hypothetical protein
MRTQHAPVGVHFAPSVMMRRTTYGAALPNGSLHPPGGLEDLIAPHWVRMRRRNDSFSVSQQRVAITGV